MSERPAVGQAVPDLPDLSHLRPAGAGLLDAVQPAIERLARGLWRVNEVGRENIPEGPVILVVNHVGVLDGPLVVALLHRAQAMAKVELWRNPLLGRFLDAMGQIPVDRWNPDPRCLRRCTQALAAGRRLVLFPEAHRGAGTFEHFKPGAAYLALVTGAPVVPVALVGATRGGTGVKSIPRPGQRVHVVYGQPVEVAPVAWPRTKAEVADLAERLRVTCADHVQQAHRLVEPGTAP